MISFKKKEKFDKQEKIVNFVDISRLGGGLGDKLGFLVV